MPISRDEFDAMGAEDEATTAERIVAFLYEHRDRAFTRSEIAEGIDRDPNTVATNLSRLKQRGLVQHRDRYWAITEADERLADAVQFSKLLSGLDERLGPLIHDEDEARAWAAAQPDEPHPSETETADSDEASGAATDSANNE